MFKRTFKVIMIWLISTIYFFFMGDGLMQLIITPEMEPPELWIRILGSTTIGVLPGVMLIAFLVGFYGLLLVVVEYIKHGRK